MDALGAIEKNERKAPDAVAENGTAVSGFYGKIFRTKEQECVHFK